MFFNVFFSSETQEDSLSSFTLKKEIGTLWVTILLSSSSGQEIFSEKVLANDDIYRDPILFPNFIHTQKRNPVTHLKDPDMFWDFISLMPMTTHQVDF